MTLSDAPHAAPASKSIRALERGLDVLQAVQTGTGLSLKELHEITGLPKATLLRILRTLTERNLVWRRMADGRYLFSRRQAAPAPGGDDETKLVEIASPLMARLCERVDWPSVLAVRRGGQMEVVETNLPRSHMSHLPLGPVGARISILLTSAGRAYFAFCSPEEREEIIAGLQDSAHPEDVVARDPAWVARLVARTQAQGFGQRDPALAVDGRTEGRLPDDGRNSIAVPIIVAGQVIATMNLTWSRKRATIARIVSEHLDHLREAAAETARQLTAGASLPL